MYGSEEATLISYTQHVWFRGSCFDSPKLVRRQQPRPKISLFLMNTINSGNHFQFDPRQYKDSLILKLINKIMFHPSSELFTGCPSKHVLSLSCQHSVTPLSLIQPLFYLSDLLHVYSPSRQLCSSSDPRTLRIPQIKTKTFGHRSFSCAAPSVRNSLSRGLGDVYKRQSQNSSLAAHPSTNRI